MFKYNVYTTTGRRIKVCCDEPLNEEQLIKFMKFHNPNYTMSTYFETTEPFDKTKAQQAEID